MGINGTTALAISAVVNMDWSAEQQLGIIEAGVASNYWIVFRTVGYSMPNCSRYDLNFLGS